jgi:SAM-dependent methyltransferase
MAVVRRMFDTVADEYDQSGVAFFQPIATRLCELLTPRAGERALDVGCGRGAVTRRLVDAGTEVTAVDFSTVMVGLTRAAIPEATVLEGDATRLELPAASYDVIASSLVLFFLPDPQAALASWLRLLAPGGRVGVTSFGEADGTFHALATLFDPFIPPQTLDPLAEREDDPFEDEGSLRRLFTGAGARDVEVRTEPLWVEYADVASWRAWTMTTGQRMFWGRMDDEQRADVLARAETLLDAARGDDGRVVVRQDVRYTLARA